MIQNFVGDYQWLSNFWQCQVQYMSLWFPSVEAYYQAMKSTDLTVQTTFVNMSAKEAKRAGSPKNMVARSDWDSIKLKVMRHGLRCKFNWDVHPQLALALVNTGDVPLIEGNYWHDNYWGNCTCNRCSEIKGQNMLGRLLMETRDWLNKLKSEGHLDKRDGYEETVVVNVSGGAPCDVYIDRRGKWGNKFFMDFECEEERNRVCDEHLAWLPTQPKLIESLPELVGKRLGCWCKPLRCHGDNLIIVMKQRGLIL